MNRMFAKTKSVFVQTYYTIHIIKPNRLYSPKLDIQCMMWVDTVDAINRVGLHVYLFSSKDANLVLYGMLEHNYGI